MTRIALLIGLSFFISACAYMTNQEENHNARCKEMKHQMMFNGATTDQHLVWTERSEQGKLQQSYHSEGC